MRRGPCARGGQGTRRATSRAGKPPSLARSVQSDVIRLSSDSLCSSLPPLKPGCGTVYLHQYAFSAYNSFCSCAYCRPVHIDAAATALEPSPLLPVAARVRALQSRAGTRFLRLRPTLAQIYGRLGITSSPSRYGDAYSGNSTSLHHAISQQDLPRRHGRERPNAGRCGPAHQGRQRSGASHSTRPGVRRHCSRLSVYFSSPLIAAAAKRIIFLVGAGISTGALPGKAFPGRDWP